jgi:hypothetical protein
MPMAPSSSDTPSLDDLAGLRTAPLLDRSGRQRLVQELRQRLAPCSWFTVGVMAPDAASAREALAALERAMGWPALPQATADAPLASSSGPVFLKANQRLGSYSLRQENGLGEGILVTGHHETDPTVGGTWGPLPLDSFNPVA